MSNEKKNFFSWLLIDSKAVSAVALVLFFGMLYLVISQRNEGYYMANTAFWLWLFFGLLVPMLIVFKLVQGYRDYLKGRSR